MPTPHDKLTPIRLNFGPGFHVEGYDTIGSFGFAIGLAGSEVRLTHDFTGYLTQNAWKVLAAFGTRRRPFAQDEARIVDFTTDRMGALGFAVFSGPNLTYLRASFPGHRALWINASTLGSPLEQAIWALETRFPNHIRRC